MPYHNILLIDDDIDDREIFVSALELVSKTVLFTALSNAKIALQKLELKELVPEVIFLDLNMPVMTGQQFLVEIKKKEIIQDIPVIVFSTTSNPTTIKLTKELGALDFVTKPHKFNDLVSMLRSLIA